MTTRRSFLKNTTAGGALFLMGNAFTAYGDAQAATAKTGNANPAGVFVRMPDESSLHKLTWMAYGATVQAWGSNGAFGANRLIARKDLMRIAANLSRFEPVIMIVNNAADQAEANTLLRQVAQEPVSVQTDHYEAGSIFTGGKPLPAIQSNRIQFVIHPLDDLWIRDTGAVFVVDAKKALYGVNFNFNGWGQVNTGAVGWKKDPLKAVNGIEDQPIARDQTIADFTLAHAPATKIATWLVMEGGGIEVDGNGTAICTESCILNPNRNPGKTKADVEAELLRTLGVRKVIWLPGSKAKDITDGHIDFYARFADNGHVVYTLDPDPESPDHAATLINQKILQNATDVTGRKINAVPLESPDFSVLQPVVTARNGWSRGSRNFNSHAFAAGYVGYYLANGCVLMAQFGDADADLAAFETLQRLFPDRVIMQITTDGIANGGGTIHCATQQQIAV
ncbi:agmatine deiminase family protein [Aquirhabdus parva]|uniref:Agmatine deiminase family protein n=1 Tax=Aquirhabdus parva TaxID=2283318 RepID=A0A345P963_9GAMM|nr:agmatine deiminase family protein [Aquirhabdus parva]AXI03822.1 agmatine deiminase family protein [Aquirhabdus parva]